MRSTRTTIARSARRLGFSIVGPLLATPPDPGQLGVWLRELADQTWRHPTTNAPLRFSV